MDTMIRLKIQVLVHMSRSVIQNAPIVRTQVDGLRFVKIEI